MQAKIQFIVRNFLNFHLNWKNFLDQKIFNNVKYTISWLDDKFIKNYYSLCSKRRTISRYYDNSISDEFNSFRLKEKINKFRKKKLFFKDANQDTLQRLKTISTTTLK